MLGVAACFAVNAATFVVMVGALRLMDPALLQRPERVPRARGQLRQALAYVRRTPALRIPLVMMVVAGIVSFNFQVLLPLLAAQTWHGTAATYAALTAAMGVGSVMGALAAGARGRVTSQTLVAAAALFGVAELLVAVAPTLELQALALVPMGAASVTFAAGVNSSLQLAAAPALRGRVMSLYSIVFLGSTPIGAPLVGLAGRRRGPAQRPLRGRRRGDRGRGLRALGVRARGRETGAPGACADRRSGAPPCAPRARCPPRRVRTRAPLASRSPPE